MAATKHWSVEACYACTLHRWTTEEVGAVASVHDVAAAVLERTGATNTFKLQKLVYYSQAWHLVWEGEPLFNSRLEAWANGPVCRELYARHRGRYTVSEWPSGDPDRLTPEELETIESVVRTYGRLSGRQLSHLTHQESPWIDARGNLPPGARGDAVIPLEAMEEYYGGLDASDQADYVESLEPEAN